MALKLLTLMLKKLKAVFIQNLFLNKEMIALMITLIADLFSDKILAVYSGDTDVCVERENTYTVILDDYIYEKEVFRGKWVGDHHEMTDELVHVNLLTHPEFWNVSELINQKYIARLNGYNRVIFEEFIGDVPKVPHTGLNVGKRHCNGFGEVIYDLPISSRTFKFDCEFQGELPKMSVSADWIKWVDVVKIPLEFRTRKLNNQFMVKIDDKVNILTAYSIYY